MRLHIQLSFNPYFAVCEFTITPNTYLQRKHPENYKYCHLFILHYANIQKILMILDISY